MESRVLWRMLKKNDLKTWEKVYYLFFRDHTKPAKRLTNIQEFIQTLPATTGINALSSVAWANIKQAVN